MKFFKKLFGRKPEWVDKKSLEIVKAFEIDGIQYYQFKDTFNMPCLRGLCALTYYDELRMRCDNEYLKLHVDFVDKVIADKKSIDIGKLAVVNKNLRDRITNIVPTDMVLKLASVIYFDENENPYVYDYSYGSKKIELWRKQIKKYGFFFQVPLSNLIPELKESKEDFQIYSEISQNILHRHLEFLTTQLSIKDLSGKNGIK